MRKLKIAISLIFVLGGWSQLLAQETVKWHTIEEVQELNKKEPRKIFIDLYTDWCGWCKVMDRETFTDPAVVKLLNSSYYAVKFDAEGADDVIFKEKVYKFVPSGRNGYHELAATLANGKLSYPTSIFLDENLNVVQPLPGYMTPDKFAPILDYIGNDHYKNTPWKSYLDSRNLTKLFF